jgi:hypothetical protein
MKEDIFLILPTQLFKDIKILKDYNKIYLVEEEYYFNSKFHKLKLLLLPPINNKSVTKS